MNLAEVGLIFILGMLAGMAANQVATRLPLHLYRVWLGEAQELLGVAESQPLIHDLQKPQPTSRQWIIAGACGLLSAGVASQFGLSLEAGAIIALTWVLLALALIDADHKLLPDVIVLPLLWAGLLLNQFNVLASSADALWGATSGYMSLWTVYWVFRLLTGKEGLGHGDFKLLGALGAWGGWQILPFTVLLAVMLGTLVHCIQRGTGKALGRSQTIAFGPYLSLAGWLCIQAPAGLFEFL
ncbi:prepilin peptidase (plasmid) [Stenotrophomonas rhizophila]|nr:prepilin peptidase [Stenotrophomonas rhizophila]